MRFFKFSVNRSISDFYRNENGWEYSFKKSKFCLASLKAPAIKEITYSKGPAVRYVKHKVVGVGYIDNNSSFNGIAFFDLPMRILIVLFICAGVWYASESIISGIAWAFGFYLLISFLSADDDEPLIKLMEKQLQL